MKVVYDHRGNRIELIDVGKSGGEGSICKIKNDDKRCAKIYYPSKIKEELHQKIRAMVSNPPEDPTWLTQKHHSIAWPQAILYEDFKKTEFVGYIMPYLDTKNFKTVDNYYGPESRKRFFGPGLTWRHLFIIAFNITSTVTAIHEKGHRIGDLRETNILVAPDGRITFIDCDSFQIKDANFGKIYKCSVGTPEFVPPELIGKSFDKEFHDRTESDYFALAILIFRLLMQGFHPYQAKGRLVENVGSTVAKIKAGFFPYSNILRGIEPPDGAPSFDILSKNIQKLFLRCFVDGHKDPKRRPTVREWFETLKAHLGDLKNCHKNRNHWFLSHLQECPWCQMAKTTGEDPFSDFLGFQLTLQTPASQSLDERIETLKFLIVPTLIDGILTEEEKNFLVKKGKELGIPKKQIEKIIMEEVQKRAAKFKAVSTVGIPKLEVDKTFLKFSEVRANSIHSSKLTISNVGGGVLTGTIKTNNKRWLKVSQSNIDPNRHRQTITVSIDSKGLSFGYNDSGEIEIISNGGNQKIIVKLSVEIKKSALNRFRKKFIPAITLIGALVGYITGCFLTDIGQLITVGALIPFSIYLGKKQTGDEWAVGCWTFIMGVIVLIILGKYYPHAFSVVGGTLSFTEIGFVLSKRLFSYHDSCQKGLTNFAPALGRNIIPVIGTIAGIMVVATIIIDTASKDTFKEIAVAPRHSRGISKKTHREPLFVRASKVNIRSGPSTRRRVIDQVKRGTVLEKLSELGSWYKVELSNGKVGWIYKNLVVSQHSETQKIRVGTSTDVSKGKRHKILKNPKKKARKRFDPSIPLPTE